MDLPELIELSRVDFVTIGAIGPPGRRTFYLQAAQDDLLITLTIEKEQAAAIAVALGNAIERLGGVEGTSVPANLNLIEPIKPLFRVGKLELGYDQERDMLIIAVEALTGGEERQGTRVHIWGSRGQMAALAHQAAQAVVSGRPTCVLCGEVINPGEAHVCVRDNGHKRLYSVDD